MYGDQLTHFGDNCHVGVKSNVITMKLGCLEWLNRRTKASG